MAYLDSILHLLGLTTAYIIAAALVLGGLYVAYILRFPGLRIIGFAITVAGFILASVTYGRQTGAQDCEERWKAANLQAQIDRAKQEAQAQQKAAELAAQQSQQLEQENANLQKQVEAYDQYLKTVVEAQQSKAPVVGCALTNDDVLQLRDIAGTGTAKRKNSK